jgi:hypothetical protein
MSSVLVATPDQSVTITAGGPRSVNITTTRPDVILDPGGMPGPQGPPGPMGPSGTMVIAVPYDEWPPADPQPNTLYLRLAP